MAYMRIRCDYCGQSWEVYGSRNWNDDRERSCPHCQAKIDRQVWEREILPAFGAFSDANRELFKDHTGHKSPLFSIDFVADHVFTRREEPGGPCPLLEDLKDTLVGIKATETWLNDPDMDIDLGLDDLDLFDLDGLERDTKPTKKTKKGDK